MNASSTNPLYLPEQVVLMFKGLIDEIPKESARLIWSVVTQILFYHWASIMGIFVSLLIVFLIKAIIGEWGSLYSLTYWTLYAVIVFIVGLIWGPEVLVSDIYHIIYLIVLYPICYHSVARIWDPFGFRRKRR